jgi:hypothetical protein
MKLRALLTIFVIYGIPFNLAAQYDYGVEVFAGPSFLRLKPGEELPRSNLVGWHTSVTAYHNRWIGLTLDVSGHHGDPQSPPKTLDVSSIDLSLRSALLGPRVRVLKTKRASATLHVLMGGSSGNADPTTVLISGEREDFSVDNFRFTSAIGGELSINLSDQFAWRIVEASYLLTTFGGQAQQGIRMSSGIAYRCC